MFGPIGMPELILVFVVALLVFGPRKLPEIGRSIGKGLAEFKKASDELKKTIEHEIEQGKAEVSSVREQVRDVQNAVASPVSPPSTVARDTASLSPESESAESPQPDPRPIHPA